MINFNSKFSAFNNAAAHVLNWNAAIGKLTREKSAIENQRKRVYEELGELMASKTTEDAVDAILDLFVVGSQFYYMVTGTCFQVAPDDVVSYPDEILESLRNLYESFDEFGDDMVALEVPFAVVDFMFSADDVDWVGALDAVLENNDSKFFGVNAEFSAAQQAKEYEERENQPFVVESLLGNEFKGYWIRRVSDDKIMKPTTGYKGVDLSPFIWK